MDEEERSGIEYMKTLLELEQKGERATISIGPYTAMTVIGALQLATRHPAMAGLPVKVIRNLVDQFKPFFEGTQGEELIKKGEHPEWDREG